MDERMCRLWAATEARSLGWGGQTVVSAATGLSCTTIRVGLKELERLEAVPVEVDQQQRRRRSRASQPKVRIRRPGAGRKLIEEKQPGILAALDV